MFVAAHNGARVWGGAERGVTAILAGLQGRGHRVLLYCNDPMIAARAGAMGVPTEIARLGGDVAVHDAVRFAGTLRRARPDALLVGTFRKAWLCALAGRLARVPRVVVRIGLETDTPRNLKYRLVMTHLADAVVLKADDLRGRYRLALPGVPDSRLLTIHGAVEPPRRVHERGAVRRELGLGPDDPVIGSVGRLAAQKRFDRLIDALALLPAGVHCVIAGEGEEREALEAAARDREVADRVHLLGDRSDVGDVLDALDVFVVSSDREMLSFAMLEALATGVPVVSTPVSGAREALEPLADGRAPGAITGFDPRELAGQIAELLADEARRQSMSEAGRLRAAERFQFPRMIERWEAVLAGSGEA